MKTAKEYWKKRFGEEPKSDSEKLAVAFAADYAEERGHDLLIRFEKYLKAKYSIIFEESIIKKFKQE